MTQSPAVNLPSDSFSMPRRAWLHMLILFAALFCLYCHTMPRTIEPEDAGEFSIVCHQAGIAHPPGYPTFTMLGWVFMHAIPIGAPCMRLYVMTACFGAAAAAILWWIARRLIGGTPAAYAAAGIFGVSRMAWGLAIFGDVYSLHAFLAFSVMALILRLLDRPGRGLWLLTVAVYGLGLTNHYPLLLLATPGLVLAGLPLLPWLRRCWWQTALVLALSLLPYAYLLLVSFGENVTAFFGPIRTWEQWIAYIRREPLRDFETAAHVPHDDRLKFLGLFAGELAAQFHWAVLGLAALGFFRQWRRWGWRWAWGLAWCYLSANVLLLLFFDVPFSDMWKTAFQAYPIVSYGIAALWAGLGLQECLRLAAGTRLSAIAAAALAAAGIALTAAGNWPVNNLRDEDFSDRVGRLILDSLPPHCVFIPHDSFDMCTTIYLHRIEGLRPDLDLMDDSPFLFPTWNFHRGNPRDQAGFQERMNSFLLRENRAVFYSGNFPHPYGVREFGLYRQIVKQMPRTVYLSTVTPGVLRMAEWLATKPPSNLTWIQLWEEQALGRCAALLARTRHHLKDAGMQARYDAVIGAGKKFPFGMTQLSNALLNTRDGQGALDLANAAIDRIRSGKTSTTYLLEAYRARAEAQEFLGDIPGAIDSMETALDCNYQMSPVSDMQSLLNLYAQDGRIEPYKALRQRLKDRGELDAWIRPLDARIGYVEK